MADTVKWCIFNKLSEWRLTRVVCIVMSVPTFSQTRLKWSNPKYSFVYSNVPLFGQGQRPVMGPRQWPHWITPFEKKLTLGVRLPLPCPFTPHPPPPDDATLCISRVFVFDYKIVSLVYCCKRFEIDTALNRVNVFQRELFWWASSRRCDVCLCILFTRITLQLSGFDWRLLHIVIHT